MKNFLCILILGIVFGIVDNAKASPCNRSVCTKTCQHSNNGYVTTKVGQRQFKVQRSCNLVQAVAACHFNEAAPFAPEELPEPKNCQWQEEVDVRLFSIRDLGGQDNVITIAEAITDMEKQDYQPADWTLLLALGEGYPDLQRRFWIYALANKSLLDGDSHEHSCFPVLTGNKDGRFLDHRCANSKNEMRGFVDKEILFLAVRK